LTSEINVGYTGLVRHLRPERNSNFKLVFARDFYEYNFRSVSVPISRMCVIGFRCCVKIALTRWSAIVLNTVLTH